MANENDKKISTSLPDWLWKSEYKKEINFLKKQLQKTEDSNKELEIQLKETQEKAKKELKELKNQLEKTEDSNKELEIYLKKIIEKLEKTEDSNKELETQLKEVTEYTLLILIKFTIQINFFKNIIIFKKIY